MERGKERAATASPANERYRAEDSIAWIADQRARNRPVEVPRVDLRAATERAEELIAKAFMAGRMLGTDDVDVALMVAKLAIARAPDAPTEADAKNILVLAATALSAAVEALIDARGPQRCAPQGSQAWVDGIALAAASRQITEQFAVRGWRDLEQRGVELRGRAVTGLLGQCHARVGEVMLDHVRAARVAGDGAVAADLCEAVVRDFEVVVEMCEAMTAAPFDEHRIALEHLRAALDELTAIRGELAPGAASLRTRCVALLARTAVEQVGPRAVLLSRIAAGLSEHFTGTAGDARVDGDAVLAASDRLRIEVDAREVQPGNAHVHVFAALPVDTELEACIYGRGPSVDEAVAQAAGVWIHAAGAPILSVLAAQPQGPALHFEGTEAWGVPGCHGFVGSIALPRGSVDPQAFATAPLFAGHSFDLDDGELHIIKAVLMGKDGRWQRTLELDGHTDKYVDAWPDGPPCPDGPTLMVRFAIARGRGARSGPAVRSHEDSPDTVSRATLQNATFTTVVFVDPQPRTDAAGGGAVTSVRRPGSAASEARNPSLLHRKPLILLMLVIAVVIVWWILA